MLPNISSHRVLHSFSIKNTFYDEMDLGLFYFDEAIYDGIFGETC